MGYGRKDTSGEVASGDHETGSENSFEDPNENRMQIMLDFAKLPESVKRRVNALKNILAEYKTVESEFYYEIFELEKKFRDRFVPLLEKRSAIISGAVDPTDEEATWNHANEAETLIGDLLKQNIDSHDDNLKNTSVQVEENADVKGIPKFWLKVLLHAPITAEMIVDNDQPILEHLTDVRVTYDNSDRNMSFSLNFYFSSNEYFKERVITKTYFFDNDLPAENPLLYEGPRIVRAQVSPITWNPGKNVTVKFVKKVKKHKNRKEVRTITKEVKQDSFFNFFYPPPESLNDEDLDEETVELLEEDFRIGSFIRDTLISQAVLFFTGEYEESDADFEEDDEDLDDDDDDDEDLDGDDDDVPQKQRRPPPTKRPSGKGNDETPECNQS
nr:nucleosome assembly protein [Hymenolepis microstoma]